MDPRFVSKAKWKKMKQTVVSVQSQTPSKDNSVINILYMCCRTTSHKALTHDKLFLLFVQTEQRRNWRKLVPLQ